MPILIFVLSVIKKYGVQALILDANVRNVDSRTKKIRIGDDIMKHNKCPICNYSFNYCQCLYYGDAHPDREKRKQVVKDHLYLLSNTQIRHLAKLESWWSTSYGDNEKNAILEELKEKSND